MISALVVIQDENRKQSWALFCLLALWYFWLWSLPYLDLRSALEISPGEIAELSHSPPDFCGILTSAEQWGWEAGGRPPQVASITAAFYCWRCWSYVVSVLRPSCSVIAYGIRALWRQKIIIQIVSVSHPFQNGLFSFILLLVWQLCSCSTSKVYTPVVPFVRFPWSEGHKYLVFPLKYSFFLP